MPEETASFPAPEDRDEVQTLLMEYLEQPSGARDLFVADLCKRHPEHATEIRKRVSLLEQFGGIDSGEQDMPQQIGPFKILDRLGEGGMGTVYMAEQREPMRRLVALKLIKLGMDSKDVVARFELERRALAAMSHRSIARVFEAGTTERGQLYFVMEFVQGLPLTRYCDKHKLSLRERIDLFRDVCAGVQHAHQKGVIHRDLKPGNILVMREGNLPVPKILDFGLAKATNRELLTHTIYTEKDRMLGTPEYMSPEQAVMDEDVIDSRADIYSLGVILYELLAGELPFSSNELRSGGWLEMQRVLAEEDAARPSTKISAVSETAEKIAQLRRLSVGDLARALRGDLDWIILKALAKEPERRYDSATELAADLKRYLDHEPVLARPPSPAYRFRKLVRRYRPQFLAAAIAVIALIAGTAGATWFMFVAQDQERIANTKAAEADRERENAREQEAIAKRESARFQRLRIVVQLEEADREQAALFPARPENADRMRAWISDRGRLFRDALPLVRQTLAELKTKTANADEQESDQFLRERMQEAEQALVDILGERGALQRVQWRLDWATRIHDLTLDHPKAPWTWEQARDAIKESPKYRDHPIDLRPQMGLVPIGENPETGLWEFYHLRSAFDPSAGGDPKDIDIPRHDPSDGSIKVGEWTGIVFVLLPGGKFFMGAQKTDRTGGNYDPHATPEEKPRQVDVEPFFLARHELTQAQWRVLSLQGNPSRYKEATTNYTEGGVVYPSNPVEQVDWNGASTLLQRVELRLPTEREWEYGCRARSSSVWFPGDSERDLQSYANVLDVMAKENWPKWAAYVAPFDDGHVIHAPVGSFRANGFGLHDTHGNVAEWCSDRFDETTDRVVRGGGFSDIPSETRSAARNRFAPTIRLDYIGVRAARSLQR